jgi:hypothetical protein
MSENQTSISYKYGLAGGFFIGLIGIYVVFLIFSEYLPPGYKANIEHFMFVLTAMVGVHLLDRAYLWKETETLLTNILNHNVKNNIGHNIKDNLEKIIPQSIEEVFKNRYQFCENASLSSLEMVYCDRMDAKETIYRSIRKSKKRLWILGIAFSEEIELREILNHANLGDKDKNIFDIRILLLDALRSPAIFRTFLESSEMDVREIINHDRSAKSIDQSEPYKETRMYSDFTEAFRLLNTKLEEKYHKNTRFYAHNPNFWMIITDDTLFFEPYTFGRGDVAFEDKKSIGSLMPIFQFGKKPTTKIFRILEDHFVKLWLTSNQDMFHMKSRIKESQTIIKSIIDNKIVWLKHVYGSLYINPQKGPYGIDDRRACPRSCEVQISVNIFSPNRENTKGSELIEGEIFNYSSGGICVIAKKSNTFNVGKTVSIKVEDDNGIFAFNPAIRRLIHASNNQFNIIWWKPLNEDKNIYGLSLVL